MTIEACRRFPGFRHVTGRYVRHFSIDRQRRVSSVSVEDIAGWLGRIARRDPSLFVLWQLGVKPAAGE